MSLSPGAANHTAGLLFDAWQDLDRVVATLTPTEAVAQPSAASSFAWTYAHLANQMDRWFNVRFQQRVRHALIGLDRFSIGGPGDADDWLVIRGAVNEVRATVRQYLERLREEELSVRYPYDGSIVGLRAGGITLRYAVMEASTHHYYHIGEIATQRAAKGHEIGDYPGLLLSYL
jgi:hypothetical protein